MATLFLPDLTRRELPIHNGEVTVPPTGVSSYHALVVESVVAGTERVAIAYVYGRGKSSGHSPSDVLNLDKTALEIVPDPLPREHWRYMAGDPYRFLLRFKGSPLPGATVTLITGNGSTMVAISDETGAVEFSLPDDFTNVKPGRSNNPPASFTVSVSLSDGATKYETSLDAVYHVNPNGHWLIGSVGWGIVSFGAFVGGIVSWRRTRQFSKGGGA